MVQTCGLIRNCSGYSEKASWRSESQRRNTQSWVSEAQEIEALYRSAEGLDALTETFSQVSVAEEVRVKNNRTFPENDSKEWFDEIKFW